VGCDQSGSGFKEIDGCTSSWHVVVTQPCLLSLQTIHSVVRHRQALTPAALPAALSLQPT
jgi:hypothetical protein